MTLQKRHFPAILDDNTETYFRHLEGIINSIDYNATVEVTRKLSGVNIRVAPSEMKFLPLLIKDIERVHNNLGLRMEYSKSMKSSGTINYNLNFGD